MMLPDTIVYEGDRNAVIGSTDARVIASGNWLDLWLEKTGQKSRSDLTFEWKPRLGLETENLHAWWHGHKTGDKVSSNFPKPLTRSIMPDHFVASIDRTVADSAGALSVLELKHTNARNTLRDAAVYYMPQLQWQMHVLGLDRLRFSIIKGNEEPEWGWVDRDDDYIKGLVAQADAFWWCVVNKEAPPAASPAAAMDLAAQAATIPVNNLRPYDMTGDNEWADAAFDFIRDKAAASSLPVSEKRIRAMIPKDAETITGAGLTFKRDARGAYRVTIDDEQLAYWNARFAALKDTPA